MKPQPKACTCTSGSFRLLFAFFIAFLIFYKIAGNFVVKHFSICRNRCIRQKDCVGAFGVWRYLRRWLFCFSVTGARCKLANNKPVPRIPALKDNHLRSMLWTWRLRILKELVRRWQTNRSAKSLGSSHNPAIRRFPRRWSGCISKSIDYNGSFACIPTSLRHITLVPAALNHCHSLLAWRSILQPSLPPSTA